MTNNHFRPSGRLTAAALAVALACAGAPSAFAQSGPAQSPYGDDGFSASQVADSVRISGADLSTAAGVQQLLHKIRMASVSVCAGQGDDPVYSAGGYFGCVRRTTADAVTRVGNPRLTALYRGEADAVLASNR